MRARWASLFFLFGAVLLGCGDSKMAEVKGRVLVDGTPLDKGAITFTPIDGKAPTAGATIEKGTYQTMTPIGKMAVAISAPKIVGMKKLYPGPKSLEAPITAEALPAKYNEKSELNIDVKAGSNDANFDLKSK